MTYKIEVQVEAIREMQVAFEWYENRRPGLGYELLDEIDLCYDKLRESPTHYSYINQRYRRISTKRFPFLLIYEIVENSVVINSTHHAKKSLREDFQ